MYHVLVGISTVEKDVIHRSLQYPHEFLKQHYHVLVGGSTTDKDVIGLLIAPFPQPHMFTFSYG